MLQKAKKQKIFFGFGRADLALRAAESETFEESVSH